MFSLELTRGIHDHLALFTRAFALAADAGFLFQNQVQDAALARGHGVKSEWSAGFADSLGGHAGGKL